MKEHLKLLGLTVQDMVTGFTGVVVCISFDLYGCVQAVVQPGVDSNKGTPEGRWFDTKRLKPKAGTKPVMAVPTFESVPGGDAHPAFPLKPMR